MPWSFKLWLFSGFYFYAFNSLHKMLDSLFTPKSNAVQGSSNEGSEVRAQFV